MTRKEAIQVLKDILEEATSDKDAVCYVTSEDAEALKMAIEALSQPIVAKCYEIDNDRVYCSPEMADKIYRALHEYTNVQNMHKGEWIKYESPVDHDDGKDAWDCSLCGAMVGKPTNFCPNCGADMRGGAEGKGASNNENNRTNKSGVCRRCLYVK